MKEFIHDLYSNENFAIYLGAIIFVLLIAFFVVFFLGKKDKEKLEKTRKLEALNKNTFKEVTTPVAVETVKEEEKKHVLEAVKEPEVEESVILNEPYVENNAQPIVTPPVVETPVSSVETTKIEPENDIPVVPFSVPEAMEAPKEEPQEPQYIIPELIELPVNNEEEFSYTEVNNNYQDLTNTIENDLHEMEEKVSAPVLNEVVEPPISLPEVEVVNEPVIEEPTTEEKKTTVVNDVFSSVYAPKKDPVMFDDTVEIELPKLR